MTTPRLALALAVLNVALLAYIVAAPHTTMAQGAAPVLRGRALEIVDDQGRVRATISVLPATPATSTAKAYPETVILRLIDVHGRPGVKVAASGEAAGLSLVGASDRTHVLLNAEGASSSLKLADGDGREQVVKP